MTDAPEPRTISGQAALSALRPHVRRALLPTIVAIEREAVAPYLAALREADALLAPAAAHDTVVATARSRWAALLDEDAS
jgi:hypothetical protein